MPGSEPGPEEPCTDLGRRPLPSSRPPRPWCALPADTIPHLSPPVPTCPAHLFLPVARLTRYHCYSGQAFAGSFGPRWVAEQIYPSRDKTGQRNIRERAVRARPPCPPCAPWNICGPAAVSTATTTECPDAGPQTSAGLRDVSSLRCLWPPPCDLGDILLKWSTWGGWNWEFSRQQEPSVPDRGLGSGSGGRRPRLGWEQPWGWEPGGGPDGEKLPYCPLRTVSLTFP